MDPYRILGLSYGVSIEEVKARYRLLAKKYHPDINKEPDAQLKFQQIGQAYQEINKNPVKPKPQSTSKTVNLDIYRILDSRLHHNVVVPFDAIPEKTRFHFIQGLDEFSIFFEKETPLPSSINIRLNDRIVSVSIVSDGRSK